MRKASSLAGAPAAAAGAAGSLAGAAGAACRGAHMEEKHGERVAQPEAAAWCRRAGMQKGRGGSQGAAAGALPINSRHSSCALIRRAFSPPIDTTFLTERSHHPPHTHTHTHRQAGGAAGSYTARQHTTHAGAGQQAAEARRCGRRPQCGFTGMAGSEPWLCSSLAAFTSSFSSSPTCKARQRRGRSARQPRAHAVEAPV